jgi:hypothetical protein
VGRRIKSKPHAPFEWDKATPTWAWEAKGLRHASFGGNNNLNPQNKRRRLNLWHPERVILEPEERHRART